MFELEMSDSFTLMKYVRSDIGEGRTRERERQSNRKVSVTCREESDQKSRPPYLTIPHSTGQRETKSERLHLPHSLARTREKERNTKM